MWLLSLKLVGFGGYDLVTFMLVIFNSWDFGFMSPLFYVFSLNNNNKGVRISLPLSSNLKKYLARGKIFEHVEFSPTHFWILDPPSTPSTGIRPSVLPLRTEIGKPAEKLFESIFIINLWYSHSKIHWYSHSKIQWLLIIDYASFISSNDY